MGQKLSHRNTTFLTKVVSEKCKGVDSTLTKRFAQNGSGDTVFTLRHKKLFVDFTVKESINGKFINWANVYGPKEDLADFLNEVGYVEEVKIEDPTSIFN